ncbi:MAG: hypothetical protein ACHQ2F_09155 [Desulfobaccales bacterium]
MKKRALALVLLAVAWGWPLAGAAAPALTLQQAEKRLVRGGYLDTLMAADWAVSQGEAIVPLLGQMLEKRQKYDRELGGATGAFPFNALWALGHIPKQVALQALEKYFASSHDPTAALAIQGWQLRSTMQSSRYGVLTNETPLLEKPRENARVVKELKAGQQVKIVREKLTSPGEEGPRGGPAYYERVELIPTGEEGYISRAGDDFSPFI